MGRFMSLPLEVNDCSYGEPPLEKEFARTVDLATEARRVFRFSSNGQTLSAKVRSQMLGRTVSIYVSVDSASSRGYNRYRDHRFDQIIGNLRALCSEKILHGNLPKVFVSFIVMRSNLGEIDDFVELMQNIGVDSVMFRSLFVEDHLMERKINHYGYAFDYDAELLARDELALVGTRCAALGRKHKVPVVVEWEDFKKNSEGKGGDSPICSEPWRTAYLLNRGLTPCCYGREPIVEWADISSDNLEEGLMYAINSDPMRELRRDLASGRLGSYCMKTKGCPIVKAMQGSPGSDS
jgi:MoaA/NifB/PqqE/SkfB family radical SAM enzyme